MRNKGCITINTFLSSQRCLRKQAPFFYVHDLLERGTKYIEKNNFIASLIEIDFLFPTLIPFTLTINRRGFLFAIESAI